MSKTKIARKWQRENVLLKKYHYFLATLKQLFCNHASLTYLELTTSFEWHVSSNHDPDNISSGGRKVILDGMVESGKLPNDNQKWIVGFEGDYFYKCAKGQEKCIVTIQSTPEDGKHISFATGCKKCGWVKHNGGYGMPKIGRNSYDRTYLRITDKNDTLLSDVKRQKEKRELYEKYDEANGTDWAKTL